MRKRLIGRAGLVAVSAALVVGSAAACSSSDDDKTEPTATTTTTTSAAATTETSEPAPEPGTESGGETGGAATDPAGTNGQGDPAPNGGTTDPGTDPAPGEPSNSGFTEAEEAYLDWIGQRDGMEESVAVARVELGYEVCDRIADGESHQEIMAELNTRPGMGIAGQVVEGSSRYLCP